MRIIGLTGPTGAGKGAFAKVAADEFGALHIDTDRVAREAVEPGTPCLVSLVEAFGTEILSPDGSLDRKALAAVVFSDREKLEKLNRITHPAITALVRRRLDEAAKNGVEAVIIDAPLLFESGEDALCDVTVGVVADENVRLERILSRDGIDRASAERRMRSGKGVDWFKERCDCILENNADRESLAHDVRAVWSKLVGEENQTENVEAKEQI